MLMFDPCNPCCGLYSAVVGSPQTSVPNQGGGFDAGHGWQSGPWPAPFAGPPGTFWQGSPSPDADGLWYRGGVPPTQLFEHLVATATAEDDYRWYDTPAVVSAAENSTLSWRKRRITATHGVTLPDAANVVNQYGGVFGACLPYVPVKWVDNPYVTTPSLLVPQGMPLAVRHEQREAGWYARTYTELYSGVYFPGGTPPLPNLLQTTTDWEPVTGVACGGGVQLGVPGSARFYPDARSPDWHGQFVGSRQGFGGYFLPPGLTSSSMPGAYVNGTSYFLPDYGYYSPSFSFVAAGKSVVAPVSDPPLRYVVPAAAVGCIPEVRGSLRLTLALNFDLLAAARPHLAWYREPPAPFTMTAVAVACGDERVVYSLYGESGVALDYYDTVDWRTGDNVLWGPWVAYGSMELTPNPTATGWRLTMAVRVRPAMYIHYNYPNIPAVDVCLVTENPVAVGCTPVGQVFNLHLPSLITNTVTDSHNAATCTVYAS